MSFKNEIYVNKAGIRKMRGYQLDEFKCYVAKVELLVQ